MADGRAGDRRARRPGRRGARAQTLGQRPRPAQAAGAAGRRRRRLRGAAERDDRLRGADDQERQRDRAARLHYAERSNGALAAIVREALAEAGLPEDAVAAAGRRRPRGAGRAGDPGRAGRPADPARRRGPEGGAEGRRDGAGDVRGGGQLPRLRARRCRPGDGAADRRQRQGAAPGRLQRGRDAARPRRVAARFLPAALADLRAAGVELVGDERARAAGRRSRGRRRPARTTGTPSTWT